MAPKIHHFIPKAILRKFCFRGETLYHYDKTNPQKGVEPRNIKSVFMKYHLNSFITDTGGRNVNLEIWFGSSFDNYIKGLTEKWENIATRQSAFIISSEDRHFFVQFLYNLMKRPPDFHQSLIEKNMSEDAIDDFLREAEEELGPIPEADKAKLRQDAKTENYRAIIRVKTLAGQSSKVLDLLNGKDILLATPQSSQKQFIVASNPVARLQNTNMYDPSCEVWTTLSPRLAVCLTGFQSQSKAILLSDANVRKLNLQLAKQSSSFAGANIRRIESLSKQA